LAPKSRGRKENRKGRGKQAEVVAIEDAIEDGGEAEEPVPAPKPRGKPGPKPGTKRKRTETEVDPLSPRKLRKRA